MNKYFSTGVVALGLLFSVGFTAQAAGLSEAQALAIINLVRSFGADEATVQNVKVAVWPGVLTDPTNEPGHEGLNCIRLSHQLTLGSTDAQNEGEISLLQTFLQSSVTGYFGKVTSAAVQKWQTAHGITITTPGVGVVGPKTRAAMACYMSKLIVN